MKVYVENAAIWGPSADGGREIIGFYDYTYEDHMPTFESVAIPFQVDGQGRRVITDFQIEREPWLLDFIQAFPHCFERSHLAQFYIFKEPLDEEAQDIREEDPASGP